METIQKTPINPVINRPMMRRMPKNDSKGTLILLVAVLLVVLGGVVTGWYLAGGSTKGATDDTQAPGVKVGLKEAGISDESKFPDTAEGILEKGGINGEGSYHLVRDEKNPSQNVYLTSTFFDMEEFVGKKVKVWGETITGQKAGWLMDVGKIKEQD